MASSKYLLAGAMAYMFNKQRAVTEMAEPQARQAICVMNSEPNQTAKGVVEFEQADPYSKTKITGEFTGLKSNFKHAFHIHQWGNLTQGCVTAGPHYNPFGQTHGGPTSAVRHVGDLGNVESDENGNSKYQIEDSQIQVYGVNSVVGRACVLHVGTDDLGNGGNEESLKTGNAGPRIACGVIGIKNY